MNKLKSRFIRFIFGSNKIGKVMEYFRNLNSKRIKKELVNSVIVSKPIWGITEECNAEHIVVSLTSYPKRFETIIPVLKSILLQEVKPNKIILWYDCEDDKITQEMRGLQEFGVEYRHISINLKPHNKYIYAMKEFPNSCIITVDDDLIYPADMIKTLVECHKKHPDCVCARRVHKISVNNEGMLMSYLRWGTEYKRIKEPSHMLCATGAGGVLYPPHCLDARAFDISLIQEYCLNADDIWLKYMELLNDTKVVFAENSMIRPPEVSNSQEISLSFDNVLHNANDIYINNLNDLFGQEIKELHLKCSI